jgi:hypothetical protein
MPDDPMIQELQRKLDEAQSLSEEDREDLVGLLAKFRELCKAIARMSPRDRRGAAALKEQTRTAWLEYFEKCREEGDAHNAALHSKANLADARSALVMDLLRNAHSIRKTVEAESYTGTWEQREKLLAVAEDTEARKEQFLSELSADQIQQLKDEGVI